jgi:hypothetical protein
MALQWQKEQTMKKSGLYANINRRKKLGISRSKKKSTISPKAYKAMKTDFGRKKKGKKK